MSKNDGYSFIVQTVHPHSVGVIIEDAEGKKYEMFFQRDFLRNYNADVVGTEGTIVFNEELHRMEIKVTKFGKVEEENKSESRELLMERAKIFEKIIVSLMEKK